MGCSFVDGRVYCATQEAVRRRDWIDTVKDGAREAADGIGDAAWSLLAFPENITKYITGTDAHYGQGRSWSYFGGSAQFNWSMRNPIFRVMDVANSVVYGGVNLVLCYTPHALSRELGLDIPYFAPPPATTRDAARDSVFLATILFGPKAIAAGERTMGLPEKTIPVAESTVAQWVREQAAFSRLSPEERAVQRLFASPQAGAVGWRVGDAENYVPGGIQPKHAGWWGPRWRTSNAENYVFPSRNLEVLYWEERLVKDDASIHQRVLHRLETMARNENVDAIDALAYLGESRMELLNDVVNILSGIGRYEAQWHIRSLAARHPDAAAGWPFMRRQ